MYMEKTTFFPELVRSRCKFIPYGKAFPHPECALLQFCLTAPFTGHLQSDATDIR